MGFFTTLLKNRNLLNHDGRPLWHYDLSDFEFSQLQSELNKVQLFNLDARDSALYFAEWWKRYYNGGYPSKQDIFKSLGRQEDSVLNAEVLYENARNGAQILRVKWIQKQNVLYFRTLLLQGGIPIKHISENKSYYQAFLLELLELQPNTIEDIVSAPHITKLLPSSSQNEIIYENCLGIIRSILNEEETHASLLEGNKVLKEIQEALNVRKHQLSKVSRINRPKIFWVMRLKEKEAKIYLRMGFSNKYTASSLAEVLNLVEPAANKSYNLYLDERLICSFRRALSGDYLTDWENQNYFRWDSDTLLPQFYCLSNDERWEINDLIQVKPTIDLPTLWTSIGDEEWRLVKGNAINSTDALLLIPKDWHHNCAQKKEVSINGNLLSQIQFEGEISISNANETFKYFSKVDSFEWSIRTEKPSWMRKTELVLVSRKLRLAVYENNGQILAPEKYKIYIKSSISENPWRLYDAQSQLPIGLINIKIDRDGIIAYDRVYNIGDLKLEVINQKLDCAELKFTNCEPFKLTVQESFKFKARTDNKNFILNLNTEHLSIPDSISFTLKHNNHNTLHFDIKSPFSGTGLIDKDGIIINEGSILTLNDLNGIRILTTNTGETIIKFWNRLRDQVKILKSINISQQPLIGFKSEMHLLFYLADAMKHDNLVVIDIYYGSSKKSFYVRGFSHSINDVSTQFERKIMIDGPDTELQLFAIPLNCEIENIGLIKMQNDEEKFHHLPQDISNGQFVIISENLNGYQLQPRFINTDPDYQGKNAKERVDFFHTTLLDSEFTDLPWKELLAYYNICLEQKIPFSTFDQIRAIGHSSKLLVKAFFFLGVNQVDTDEFIQRQVPALEQDLGFCFHWVKKQDWEEIIESVQKWIGLEHFSLIMTLMHKYFQDVELEVLYKYISGHKITKATRVNNQIINEARAQLGVRVLSELPEHTPHCTSEYSIPVEDNRIVKLLLRAPIAVAESISGVAEKSIWENNVFVSTLRRNIQYVHFIAPELYSKVLYHCLS